jgi:hypothetical protein
VAVIRVIVFIVRKRLCENKSYTSDEDEFLKNELFGYVLGIHLFYLLVIFRYFFNLCKLKKAANCINKDKK